MSEHVVQKRAGVRVQPTWRWMAAPAVALIVLSPIIAEVLMGSTPITKLWLLVPEMGTYGVGALIIRDLVRRQQRGWGTVLMLGIAFAVLVECVILQTSLTPQFFGQAGANSFGWVAGVQWLYLLAMLGYESVYGIVIPIQLVELLFPARRDEPWLSDGALGVAAAVFVLASVAARELWTRGGVTRFGSSYEIPLLPAVVALVVAAALVAATLALGRSSRPDREAAALPSRRARSPWLAGLAAFVFGLIWWLLVVFSFLDRAMLPGVPPLALIVLGLAWAGLAFLSIRRLATAAGWEDIHRLALIYGALLASMLGGALTLFTATPADRIGKLVLDLVAVVLLAVLAWRLRRRPNEAPPAGA